MFVIKKLTPHLPGYSRACVRSHPSLTFRRNAGAYDGIAKTHAVVLNKSERVKSHYEPKAEVKMIDTYSQAGFRLTDDSFVYGPMILYKNHVLCWNVAREDDIDEASLEFFCHLVPPIDLLIVGYGDFVYRHKLNKNLLPFAAKNGFHLELTPTANALATYNFLVDNRHIAGAFMPPSQYVPNDYDQYLTRLRNPNREDPDGLDEDERMAIYGSPKYRKTY